MYITERSRQPSLFLVLAAALALGWAATVAAEFPATGQTRVYRTGDDGDIQAGATLSYKDNGNGTITDRNTRLVWEKKSFDGGIHDQFNIYTWNEAFDVHVATLNTICANDEIVTCAANADCVAAGVGGKCGFARKRDWRVPNVKELQSIVNYQNRNPSVSDAFKFPCVAGTTVLDGSCNAVQSAYWSSTTSEVTPGIAWVVSFVFGNVTSTFKDDTFQVRAVRDGSP